MILRGHNQRDAENRRYAIESMNHGLCNTTGFGER